MPVKKKLQKDSGQGQDNLSEGAKPKFKKGPPRKRTAGNDIIRKSGHDQEATLKPMVEHSKVNDIRPKNGHADASFLAPENTSFGLREKHNRNRTHAWLRGLAYFLGTIIVLIAIVFVGLSYYSQKLLNETSSFANQQLIIGSPGGDKSAINVAKPLQQQTFKMAIVNAPGVMYDYVTKNITANFKKEIALEPATATVTPALPVSDKDILYYKKSAQGISAKLLDFLNGLGIRPVIQEGGSQSADMVLYLSSDLKVFNLVGYTAAVYNGSGKAGEAKRFCAILSQYKVENCLAMNSAKREKNIQIFYRDKRIITAASRIPELKLAEFFQAPVDQTEDLRIVIGN